MAKELIVPSKFTINDQFSSPFAKMTAMASESIDSMAGKASKFSSFIKNNSDTIRNMGRNATIAGGVVLGSLGAMANEAIKFEDKMADVAKVMNLDFGSSKFNSIGDEVKDLAAYLAVAPDDAAALYASLAQGGAPLESLNDIAKTAGEIGVAFGISSEEAGTSFIKLRNAMGLTIEETKKVTDSINHLGDSTASASDELLEFMASGGAGAARNLNLAGQEAAAFGSILISNGKSASEAGTIFERMMKGIMSNAGMKKMFDDAGGGVSGLVSIMERASKMDANEQFKFFSSFGAYGTDISMFAKNFDSLRNTLEMVNDESKFYNSSLGEFENRQKTSAVQLEKMKTEFKVLAIEIGSAVLPILRDLMEAVSPIIKSFAEWVKDNKSLVSSIVKVAAGFGALMVTIGPVLYAIGSVHNVMDSARKAMAIGSVAMKAFGIASTTALWPLTLIIGAIGLAVVAYKGFNEMTKKAASAEELATNVKKRALEATIDQRVESKLLFDELKRSKTGTDEYNATLSKLDGILPGIIDKYRNQKGEITDLIGLQKEYNATLLERAKQEAAAELAKETIKAAMQEDLEGPSVWDMAKGLIKNPLAMFGDVESSVSAATDAFTSHKKRVGLMMEEGEMLAAMSVPTNQRVLTPEQTSGSISQQQSEVLLKIDNAGSVQTVDLTGGKSFSMNVMPAVGSTVK